MRSLHDTPFPPRNPILHASSCVRLLVLYFLYFLYLLYFQLLPHSFSLTKNATLLLSVDCALFTKNTGGGGTSHPLKENQNETENR